MDFHPTSYDLHLERNSILGGENNLRCDIVCHGIPLSALNLSMMEMSKKKQGNAIDAMEILQYVACSSVDLGR